MNSKNLLDEDVAATFGNIDAQAVPRNTVVAVVFDRSSSKYLCQYWEDYSGLTCLLSGGIEDDESSDEALKREILEETGYTDFQVMGVLGGNIKTYYRKNTTGESLVKNITPYLVLLNSLEQVETKKEDDEKFDNLFKSPDEILKMMERYEATTGSTLADHTEILKRAVTYLG